MDYDFREARLGLYLEVQSESDRRRQERLAMSYEGTSTDLRRKDTGSAAGSYKITLRLEEAASLDSFWPCQRIKHRPPTLISTVAATQGQVAVSEPCDAPYAVRNVRRQADGLRAKVRYERAKMVIG